MLIIFFRGMKLSEAIIVSMLEFFLLSKLFLILRIFKARGTNFCVFIPYGSWYETT